MYKIFNQSKFKYRRKELRKNQTAQESLLWLNLKNKKLGVKFRRQQSVGPYIADFYCKEKSLVIEIDGSQHTSEKEYDRERNAYMQTLGLKVLRFWNSEIENNFEYVLKKIKDNLLPLRRGSAPEKFSGARG